MRSACPWSILLLVPASALCGMLVACATLPPATRPALINGELVFSLPNAGFEDGLRHWTAHETFYGGRLRSGVGKVTVGRAAEGTRSLRVTDDGTGPGARILSEPVPVSSPGLYELRGKVFLVSGHEMGAFVRVLDADGGLVFRANKFYRELGGAQRKWNEWSLDVYVPEPGCRLQVWFTTWRPVEAYIDDLTLVMPLRRNPPREPEYRIKPGETERLTAADVVGPDGIVYPNWTICGVRDGIPDVESVVRARDFGAAPDDEGDDSSAVQRACDAAGEAGGGAVVLEAGTYQFDRCVTIRHDGVVIRGQGRDRTRVIFRYTVPDPGVAFYWPEDGGRVGSGTRVEVHARPKGLETLKVAAGDKTFIDWRASGTDPHNLSRFTLRGSRLLESLPAGEHTLTATAGFEDGRTGTAEIRVVLDPEFREDRFVPNTEAVFLLQGRMESLRIPLAEDGERGDTSLVLESNEGLEVGDMVVVRAPVTERWRKLSGYRAPHGWVRLHMAEIEAIEGNRISFATPLRIDFPVVDGSQVRLTRPVRRCGIEDLYIEQTARLNISSVEFSHATDCWVHGLRVVRCGDNPIHMKYGKWCEVRDCIVEQSWYNGGGSAYVGGTRSFDCLWDGIRGTAMRHAPVFQFASAGNVFRNSTFRGSDIQFHAGWTHDNLIENCVVDASTGSGSYGHGVYATGPKDLTHGPEGPRNVIYNCDISCPRDGVHMGGMNEAWIFVGNRFVVGEGRGVYAARASFDHIIRENVFVLKNPNVPMIMLATPDCIGLDVAGNRLFGGNGRYAEGMAAPLVLKGNTRAPLPETLPPRPTPAVESIYEWQREHAGRAE